MVTRPTSKGSEVTPLTAVQGSKPDVGATKTVRLELDAETFDFFGSDTREMESALRRYAEEQSVKEAYEMTRLGRLRSK